VGNDGRVRVGGERRGGWIGEGKGREGKGETLEGNCSGGRGDTGFGRLNQSRDTKQMGVFTIDSRIFH